MDWKKEIREWLVALAGAVVAGLLLTQFIIISIVVPSRSMQDTINPGDRIVGFRLSYLFSEPQRGDIVIFRYPDDETQFYIKRIIGLPGETVEVKDGFVLIDGQPLDESYIKEKPNQDSGPWTVPEGCYFMMGDNRNNSNDSRAWINPFVKREKILGKAIFRYWPSLTWMA